jgi:hypothetical protein
MFSVCSILAPCPRRKGEITRAEIDRCFPHQIELPVPPNGFGARLAVMYGFCREHCFAYQTRPARRRGEGDAVRWCFRLPADAERFCERFGGEPRDPRAEAAARRPRRGAKIPPP